MCCQNSPLESDKEDPSSGPFPYSPSPRDQFARLSSCVKDSPSSTTCWTTSTDYLLCVLCSVTAQCIRKEIGVLCPSAANIRRRQRDHRRTTSVPAWTLHCAWQEDTRQTCNTRSSTSQLLHRHPGPTSSFTLPSTTILSHRSTH